ncbi:hypothetical protein A2U01_0082655, partial [Trifolium medium]|nr:hypothetical protein [Trifolium medium]
AKNEPWQAQETLGMILVKILHWVASRPVACSLAPRLALLRWFKPLVPARLPQGTVH